MNPDIFRVIAEMLRYSLGPTGGAEWRFSCLTSREQAIVGDQETLNRIRAFVTLAAGDE